MMRELSCFGDGSVCVATASVSGRGGLDRALQAATTSVYRAALPSNSGGNAKEVLVRVTWTRTAAGAAGLAVAFDEQGQRSQQLVVFQKRRRGSRSLVTGGGTVVGVHWDTAEAKYDSSPEPDGDYYLAVVADGELALLLGSGCELSRRFGSVGSGSAVLVSRREQVRGGAAHVTRCRFREGGEEHEVAVHASRSHSRKGERGGGKEEGEVRVTIDGEKVAEVRRLGWAFRGNRVAVLPNGEIVDVMWDLHDWWFGGAGTNGAQFMVKARAEKEGRLWMAADDHTPATPPAGGGGGFFLHVQCYPR